MIRKSAYRFFAIAFFVFHFGTSFSFGQNSSTFGIKGKLIDKESSKPIEFATVSLIRVRDSINVANAYTDIDGNFELETDNLGSYYFESTLVGYQTLKSPVFELLTPGSINSLGIFYQQVDQVNLEKVEITERKAEYVAKLDKKEISMADNVNAKGSTLYDMLNTLPSIDVDNDGNVSLRGNTNVRILIDGRNSGLSSVSALKQIAASSVEKIEIINNPSAKYDAEGNAGIINIIMKKSAKAESNGAAYIGYVRGAFDRYNAGANYNYKKDRFLILGNYGFQSQPSKVEGFSQRSITTVDTFYTNRQNSLEIKSETSHNAKLGFDYYYDKNNIFYAGMNYRITPDGKNKQNTDFLFWPLNDQSKFGKARRFGVTDIVKKGIDINTGWIKKFDQVGRQLDVDLAYSNGDDKDDSYFYQNNEIINNYFKGVNTNTQHTSLDEKKDIYIGRADYVHPLTKDRKLEMGFLLSKRILYNNLASETYDSSAREYVNDRTITNSFNYDEIINAGYFIWRQKLKNWEYNIGVRLENTRSIATLFGELPNKRSYTDPFPTFQIQRKLGKSMDIMLTYSRRINRPNIQQLNPFVNLSDPYSIRTGNPAIKPEYINGVELGYIKYWRKWSFNQSFYYRHVNNSFRRIVSPNYITGGTLVKWGNLSYANQYGSEFVVNGNFSKKWKANSTINFFTQYYHGETQVLNINALLFNMQWSTSYSISPQWSIQLNGRYNAPFDTPQGRLRAMVNTNGAVTYSDKNERFNIVLRGTDIFMTQRFNIYSNIDPNFLFEGYRRQDATTLGATFTWNLGTIKKQIKSIRKEEEKQQYIDAGG